MIRFVYMHLSLHCGWLESRVILLDTAFFLNSLFYDAFIALKKDVPHAALYSVLSTIFTI